MAARAYHRAIAVESTRPRQVTFDERTALRAGWPQSPASTTRQLKSCAASASAVRFFASSQMRPAPKTTSDLSGNQSPDRFTMWRPFGITREGPNDPYSWWSIDNIACEGATTKLAARRPAVTALV